MAIAAAVAFSPPAFAQDAPPPVEGPTANPPPATAQAGEVGASTSTPPSSSSAAVESAPAESTPAESTAADTDSQQQGIAKQTSIYMGSPIWLTKTPLDPGFEVEMRTGLKLGILVPELGLGARWNWISGCCRASGCRASGCRASGCRASGSNNGCRRAPSSASS